MKASELICRIKELTSTIGDVPVILALDMVEGCTPSAERSYYKNYDFYNIKAVTLEPYHDYEEKPPTPISLHRRAIWINIY